MKTIAKWIAATLLLLTPAAALPQLALPGVGPALPLPDRSLSNITDPLVNPVSGMVDTSVLDRLSKSELRTLLNRLRIDRLNQFLRQNRDYVERDRNGDPAVRGVLIVTGISAASLERAQKEGFEILERNEIEGLDLSYVKFATRLGKQLKSEQKQLQKLAREAEVSADNIYFTSGAAAMPVNASALSSSMLAGGAARSGAMGLIDGGVARHSAISMPVEQRGFAKGAPIASSHGTAIASLVSSSLKANARGLLAADIYGNDPAGGNATAIARALGWMAQRNVPVVAVSLVGPDNALLGRAVRAAQQKGMLVVAAVGNDGPAAPPRYPAAYKGVIGVTGVDHRERALPEAGIATPVDFAAPGAGIKGASPDGSLVPLRGTSFAAPLVAARLLSHYPAPNISKIEAAVTGLIGEAKDLGKKGADKIYGNGLVCGNCGLR
ncbi:S8 family serine peptidase [uncultured Parasphingorhabdus sp.]|uniref:S8 family serine peptidase n=1 Tax=uncultured Parasphingorhabdus sp. TaxID=2709694 RepID=UPI0030D95343|tara:strand:- start:53290 stop:54603 length:1314 start_codon:yes stop_codon:yes gene_type:complete